MATAVQLKDTASAPRDTRARAENTLNEIENLKSFRVFKPLTFYK